MENDLDRIARIVRKLFDEYAGPVTPLLSAHDVAQWNSLMHVQFLVLVEKEFGIYFSSREVGTFRNIGDLMAALQAKRPLQ